MRELAATKMAVEEPIAKHETPETYLGYSRADHFSGSRSIVKDQSAEYAFPKRLGQHNWALQGGWKIMPDRVISEKKNAAIEINFHARKVFIVMGNATNKAINVELFLNGKKILVEKGKDVVNSSVNVKRHSLYEVIDLNQPGNGILQVISTSPGLEVYTFTFG
jgi:hypothetical protein